MTLAIDLPPLSRTRAKLRAKFACPIFVETLEFHDGGCAEIAQGQSQTASFGIGEVVSGGLLLAAQILDRRQSLISQRTDSRDVEDGRPAGQRRLCLLAERAQMIEGVGSDPNLKVRRLLGRFGYGETEQHQGTDQSQVKFKHFSCWPEWPLWLESVN